MEKSFSLYSKIPGLRLTYGGKPSDCFTTFEIGTESKATTYLNLEWIEEEGENDSSDFYKKSKLEKMKVSEDFVRIILHTENLGRLLFTYETRSIYLEVYCV